MRLGRVILGAAVVITSSAFATIRNVPGTYSTIQAGINAAVNGDTVLVGPGTHSGPINGMGKSIVIMSSSGAQQTTITAQAGVDVVTFDHGEGPTTVLEGFRILGGSIGIACYSSSPTIRRNILDRQGKSDWAALVLAGAPGATGPANAIVENNTILHSANGGISSFSTLAPTIRNNIIAFNSGYGIHATGPINLYYNDVVGTYLNCSAGVGSIAADPLLDSLYAPLVNSPCINAGDPEAAYNDFDGSRNDMGAVPFQGQQIFTVTGISYSPSIGTIPAVIYQSSFEIRWELYVPMGEGQVAFEIEVGLDADWTVAEKWATGTIWGNSQSVFYTGDALDDRLKHYVRLRAFNGSMWSQWSESQFFYRDPAGLSLTIRVPQDAPTVQGAVDAAYSGDTVLVSPGLYAGSVLVLEKQVAIIGERGPQQTTLTCGPGQHIIELRSDTLIGGTIEGFTLQGGNRAIFCVNASPHVRRCILLDNAASSWAAIVLQGSSGAIIENNTIRGAGNGAISTLSSVPPVIKNNIIAFNGNYTLHVSGAIPIFSYNDAFSNPGGFQGDPFSGEANLSSNPLLNSDFSLSATSPCIDQGDPSPQYNDSDGTRNDIGAIPWIAPASPPVLQTIGQKSGIEGTNIQFVVHATDANGTVPSLSALSLPENASFVDHGTSTGEFGWTPTYSQAGSYDVLFIASDGTLADSEIVHFEIANVPLAPVIDSLFIDGTYYLLNIVSQTPLISWSYSDPDPETAGQQSFEVSVGTDNEWTYAEKWNPALFVSSDTFVTYDGSALVDGQTYYLRLRVFNGSVWSPWFYSSFRMNSVPTPPVPLTAEGSRLAALPLLWVQNGLDGENDPLTYDFTCWPDVSCSGGPTFDLTGVPPGADSSAGQVLAPLAENCRYWWRARSFDSYEYSAWSDSVSFYLDGTPEPPQTFLLLAPLAASPWPVFSALPDFSWQAASDPDPFDTVRYKIEISDRANFSFAYVRDSLLTPSFTMTDSLLWGTKYYWRVMAKDKTGLSPVPVASDFWTWLPGDITHDHSVDISDLQAMVDFLFFGGAIQPPLVGDLTGDCQIDIADLQSQIDYLFFSGPKAEVGC